MRVFGKLALGLVGLVVVVGTIVVSSEGSSKRKPVVAEDPLPRLQRSEPPVERYSPPIPVEPAAVPSTVPAVAQPARENSEPDRAAELATILQAQYAVDARPTRESFEKEKALKNLFSEPKLEGKGQLEEVDCRDKVCRGVVRIVNEEADGEVFGQTFLSAKFAEAIPDAITIASREKMRDGSVLATFFIHPQSTLDMVPR